MNNQKPKKKSSALLVVFIVLITNFITFLFITSFGISFGNRSVIAVDNAYTAKKVNKLLYLYDKLNDQYITPLDKDALWEKIYAGLFEATDDPYTMYLDPASFHSYKEDLTGNYSGIGVRIAPGEDDLITVVTVFRDSPADKAGIRTGDKVIIIAGEDATTWTVDEGASKMRGEPGTVVEITVLRAEDKINFTLTRAQLSVEAVEGTVLPGNIGYIYISEFSANAADQFTSLLADQLSMGIESLIIDLRNNPGGDVNETLKIADRILGDTMIIYTKNNQGKKQEFHSSADESLQMPIVVLVNEYTASASEILAVSLKDNQAATLIGTNTYGKGIIQTFHGMMDGSGYKITVEKYFSPSGQNIHDFGVKPHLVVPLPEGVSYIYGKVVFDQDTQLQEAIKYLTK